jgi:hypothetical protein
MKTAIRISGQVASKNRLKMLIGLDSIETRKFFNDTIYVYQTKKQALEDIKKAGEVLKNDDDYDEDDMTISIGEDYVTYDAATARIETL